jgi:uncharacterized protein YfdQ (DUF2303 family)
VPGKIPIASIVADSAEATGLKWAAPAGGLTFVGAQAWQSTAVSLSNNTWTAMTLTNEDYDSDSFHSNSTNTSRMTIPSGKGGKYLLQCSFALNSTNMTGYRSLAFYKNGTAVKTGGNEPYGTYPVIFLNAVMEVAANDYVEIYLKQDSGGTFSTDTFLGQQNCWFAISYLGA